MFAWLRKKNPTAKLKEVQIGDGNLTLDLSSYLEIEREEDHTTVVYDPDFIDAIARFSILYISNEHNPDAEGLAINYVIESAKEKGYKLKKAVDKQFYTYVEQSELVDEPRDVYYWVIGVNNAAVIASCWISRGAQNQPQAQDLLNTIEPAIRSLRTSKVSEIQS